MENTIYWDRQRVGCNIPTALPRKKRAYPSSRKFFSLIAICGDTTNIETSIVSSRHRCETPDDAVYPEIPRRYDDELEGATLSTPVIPFHETQDALTTIILLNIAN